MAVGARMDSRWAPHPAAVFTAMPDGGVLLHLRSKQYFVLNQAAWVVWRCIEQQPSTVAELAAALTAAFEVDATTARNDVEAVLDELEAEELVQPR